MTPLDILASAMSLRDHFAGLAMSSMLVRADAARFDALALTAYVMADEMLAARAEHMTSWPRLHTNTDFMKE